MSLSSSQKSWATLVKSTFALGLCLSVLTGCSSLNKLWPNSDERSRDEKLAAIISGNEESKTQKEKTPEKAQKSTDNKHSGKSDLDLFKPEQEPAQLGILQFKDAIKGGKSTNRLIDTLVGDRSIRFKRPVAVCVRGDLMYVVDMDLMAVLRYQLVTGEIDRVLDLSDEVAGDVADIYVNKDLSFYITDTYGARVLRYSHNGKLQRIFSNKLNLAHPVAVVEDEVTEAVLIADGEFDHVVVFNQDGDPYTTIGQRGSEAGELLNTVAMAITRSDVYIASRVGGRIQVLSRDGDYLYSLQQDVMRFPLALEVVAGKVFTSDYLDNTIKIFERGRLVETVGGTGVMPGRFKRITDLWYDNGLLYTVDSLNGRVQRFKVAGEVPSIEPQGKAPQAPGK